MKKLITCFALLFACSSQAAIIDFEDIGVASGGNNIGGDRTSSGFEFDVDTDHSHVANNSFGGNSGSSFLVVDNYQGTNSLTMSSSSGDPFGLISLELGEWNTGNVASTIRLIGNLFGGGTIQTTFTLDGVMSTGGSNNFELFNLGAGWGALTSVNFMAIAGAGDLYWGVDNINVSAANLPEPSSLIIMALGLIGLGYSRKAK